MAFDKLLSKDKLVCIELLKVNDWGVIVMVACDKVELLVTVGLQHLTEQILDFTAYLCVYTIADVKYISEEYNTVVLTDKRYHLIAYES